MKNRIYRALIIVFSLSMILGSITPVMANKTKPVLRVAYWPLDGFFEYNKEGKEVGYGVELLEMISKYTGYTFTYVKADSWEATKEMILNDEADIRMPGTLPINPSTTLDYSEQSIIDSYYAIMALKNRDDLYYQDYEKFKQVKIGISQIGFNTEGLEATLAAKGINRDSLVVFDNYLSCRQALANNEIDVLISNIMDLDDEMKQLDQFQSVSNYLSMKKGATELTIINDTLHELKLDNPTFMSNLYKKWFPDRVAVPFTKEESDCLNNLKEINFIYCDNAGYLSRKEKDKLVGIYPTLAKKICNILDVNYAENQSDNKTKVYMHYSYDHTWAKQHNVAITQPYRIENYYEIIHKNTKVKASEAKVATIEGSQINEKHILKTYKEDQLVYYQNYKECLDALNSSKVDVAYLNSDAAEYYLSMYHYNNLSSSLIEYSQQSCIGVAGDNNELIANIINKALITIPSDEISSIVVKTTSQKPAENIVTEWVYQNPRTLIFFVSTFLLITFGLIIAFVFNLRMRKKNQTLLDATNAKSAFLSRMSHDMRTPMNAIIGFSRFGKDSKSLDEAKDYHHKINDAGIYLLQLINDTLQISRLEQNKYALNLEPYSNIEFKKDIESILASQIKEKKIDFEIICPTVSYSILIDHIRLQQIFVNLINNAIKFSHFGGKVRLVIDTFIDKNSINTITFKVIDEGIGMSKEFQEKHLFKAFEQERISNEEGTGLGLAIVKDLVEAMNGTISCVSEINHGTTFTVVIKASVVETNQPNEIEEVTVDDDIFKGKRILVCEDNKINQVITNKLLVDMGIIVDNADDGQIGLDKFIQAPINYYDLILMDVRMPNLDGVETTRKIRLLKRDDAKTIPIIALSANALSEDIEAVKDAGMNDHLAKPIDVDRMYRVLKEYLKE